MKYKIKNFEYVNPSNIIDSTIDSYPRSGSFIKRIIKGVNNLDIIPYNQEFEYYDTIYTNGDFNYYLLECDYGIFIAREDNVEQVEELQDTLNDLHISKMIKSGNKTILIDNDGDKFITTKHPDDKEDLEKAVMVLLLKRQNISFKQISKLVDYIRSYERK